MRIGKITALLLSCALLLTIFPSVEGYAADEQNEPVSASSDVALYATGWQKKPTKTVSSASNFPVTLNNGDVLQINGTINYTAPAGVSPITVAANATVSIIINGSVTLHGANASGTTGATAAIKVPSSSKLYIYSAHDEELSTSTSAPKDTLTVTGGNAAAGTNGANAERKYTSVTNGYEYTWYTGSGGAGGGGAAAAIGGNGGTGGSGASGWLCVNNGSGGDKGKTISVRVTIGTISGVSYNNNDDNPGKAGADGGKGTAGEGTGTIYIPGRLTLVANGGSAAAGGKGGSGCGGSWSTSGKDETIGGCGGGGGGGGGCAAPAIGAGGAGGSGGGSGGQLSSDHNGEIAGCGGGGGGGGWPNGGGGGGGGTTTSKSSSGANHDGGAGGAGGAAGSAGSAGSSGRTTNSSIGSTASGGSGGGGVQSGTASGGSGGVRVKKTSAYPGGRGGAGGAAVPYTAWQTAGSLILSTANNLNLSNGSLGYGYGDGQGYGSTPSRITPYIIYDLMDCSVTVSGSYTYTGAAIQPAKSNVTIKYSASTDRDGARVSFRDITVTNYTLSYGNNIHCPTGTVTATGGNDANRATVLNDGAVVGAKTANFTINKATLTKVNISAASYELKMAAGASESEKTKLILGNYYESTAASDTKKYTLNAVWLNASGTTGWPVVDWQLLTGGAGMQYGYANPDAANQPLFYGTSPGFHRVGIKLSGMNDFEDYTQEMSDSIHVKSYISGKISPNPVHPRQETVTVSGITTAANATVTWYRGSTQVGTGLTYTPTNADAGKTLTVKIVPKTTDEYETTNLTVQVENHSYDNGFCSVCGEYEKPSGSSTAGYTIKNGGQLFWFAAQVNGDSTHAEDVTEVIRSINGTLTNDIDLQNPADTKAGKTTEWTPMGSTTGGGAAVADQYSGTFNGSGHTIKGMSITTSDARTGLFADAGTGAVIKNFTIEGNITLTKSNSGTNAGIGGAVGYMYKGEVSDVTSKVTIQNGANDGALTHVGGVVGGTYTAGVNISRCVFEGSISVYNSYDCIGGVVGYSWDNTVIEYCANRGTVKANSLGVGNKAPYVGGILGYINTASNTAVKNCYNYGSVSCVDNTYCGAVVGLANKIQTLDDCYYLSGSATKGIGKKADYVPMPPAMSKDKFESGEVCYLVNSKTSTGDKAIWKQNIDNDKTPYDLYPVFDAEAVYFRSDSTYSNYPERISVTISWGDMEFEYDIGTWEPNTHTYVGGGWSAAKTDGGKLSVTNQSNVSLQVQFTFAPDTALTSCGLTGSFGSIPSGENQRMAPDAVVDTALTLQSKAPDSIKNAGKKKLGNITVRLTTLGGGT